MLCGYTPFWDGGSPMKIYENILKGKVKYPPYVNGDAQDLLERLITADLTTRLGNLFGGPQDDKSHPWFAEVTWGRLGGPGRPGRRGGGGGRPGRPRRGGGGPRARGGPAGGRGRAGAAAGEG